MARRLRRSDEAARFGAHLDSVVDACSFGLAPAVLLHAAGLRSLPELLLLGAYVACAAWRLAYFDTMGTEMHGNARYYRGLPTTFVALVLPFSLLTMFWGRTALRLSAGASALALAILMVSPIPIRKPGGACYVLFLALAIGMVIAYLVLGPSFPA